RGAGAVPVEQFQDLGGGFAGAVVEGEGDRGAVLRAAPDGWAEEVGSRGAHGVCQGGSARGGDAGCQCGLAGRQRGFDNRFLTVAAQNPIFRAARVSKRYGEAPFRAARVSKRHTSGGAHSSPRLPWRRISSCDRTSSGR